ncbi:hypothetical protein [Prevotella heparinolytica]|uniref:hypothetical protein n=1 Tax=Prevotella heparinolytica TaxID=28113 RepID=UPI0013EF5D72|nr:hypothetical protein [Bacteroides heparinolyticus]
MSRIKGAKRPCGLHLFHLLYSPAACSRRNTYYTIIAGMRALLRRGRLPRYGERDGVTIARRATSLRRDDQRRHSEAGGLVIAAQAASTQRGNTPSAGGLSTEQTKN